MDFGFTENSLVLQVRVNLLYHVCQMLRYCRLILHAVIISSAVVAGMMVSLFCLSAIYLPSPESEVAVYSAVKTLT